MQPQSMLNMLKILLIVLGKTFVEWVFIAALSAIIIMLCLAFGGPDMGTTLMEPGSIESIAGTAYASATVFIIQTFADTRSHGFYYLVMGISIAIAISVFFLFGDYFIFFLSLGSVAIWYQITLVQLRPVTTLSD